MDVPGYVTPDKLMDVPIGRMQFLSDKPCEVSMKQTCQAVQQLQIECQGRVRNYALAATSFLADCFC